MSSYSRIQLEDYLKLINVNTYAVLDIGGSQNSIKGRTGSWNVKEYSILDLKKPHENKRKPDYHHDLNISLESGRAVIENKSGEPVSLNNYYDVAFCIEVSEYWWNPLQALKNINSFLKKGGILYISFHFIYPHHEPNGEDCLRYTLLGARKLLEKTGFKIKGIYPRYFNNKNIAVNVYNKERMRGLNKNNNYVHEIQGIVVEAIK